MSEGEKDAGKKYAESSVTYGTKKLESMHFCSMTWPQDHGSQGKECGSLKKNGEWDSLKGLETLGIVALLE